MNKIISILIKRILSKYSLILFLLLSNVMKVQVGYFESWKQLF
jgi:hypothetical protein